MEPEYPPQDQGLKRYQFLSRYALALAGDIVIRFLVVFVSIIVFDTENEVLKFLVAAPCFLIGVAAIFWLYFKPVRDRLRYIRRGTSGTKDIVISASLATTTFFIPIVVWLFVAGILAVIPGDDES